MGVDRGVGAVWATHKNQKLPGATVGSALAFDESAGQRACGYPHLAATSMKSRTRTISAPYGAQGCSPRRKPWEIGAEITGAPAGRKIVDHRLGGVGSYAPPGLTESGRPEPTAYAVGWTLTPRWGSPNTDDITVSARPASSCMPWTRRGRDHRGARLTFPTSSKRTTIRATSARTGGRTPRPLRTEPGSCPGSACCRYRSSRPCR